MSAVTTDHLTIVHADVPEWIHQYADQVRDLFGLHEWNLWIEYADRPGNADDTDGNCELLTRYLRATITIRRSLTDQERIRAVVMHELAHVLLGYLDQATMRLIDLIPDEMREHALELHSDAEEQTIERLIRGLQQYVPLGTTEG